MRPLATGLMIGIGGAAVAVRLVRSQLFEVERLDPVMLVGVGAMLAAIATAAAFFRPDARLASIRLSRCGRSSPGVDG